MTTPLYTLGPINYTNLDTPSRNNILEIWHLQYKSVTQPLSKGINLLKIDQAYYISGDGDVIAVLPLQECGRTISFLLNRGCLKRTQDLGELFVVEWNNEEFPYPFNTLDKTHTHLVSPDIRESIENLMKIRDANDAIHYKEEIIEHLLVLAEKYFPFQPHKLNDVVSVKRLVDEDNSFINYELLNNTDQQLSTYDNLEDLIEYLDSYLKEEIGNPEITLGELKEQMENTSDPEYLNNILSSRLT